MNTPRSAESTADRMRALWVAAAVVLLFGMAACATPGGAARIVVTPFDDESHSGFLNLPDGVADLVASQLRLAGFDVVEWSEVESTLQELSLSPRATGNVFSAAMALGANLAVFGTIDSVSVQEASLYVGLFRFSGGSASVALSAKLLDVASGETLATVGTEGRQDGSTGFTLDLGDLFSASEDAAQCTGGLRAVPGGYARGELVTISYRNASAPSGWYSVEIRASSGRFLRWLGWEYVETNECRQWTWDQADSLGMPQLPGIYTARISDGQTVLEYTNFQIRPDTAEESGASSQITVGEPAFEGTIVGQALACAVDDLSDSLIPSLVSVASQPAVLNALAYSADEAEAGAVPVEPTPEGQIAAFLPDGRIAITIGATAGLAAGDVLMVFSSDTDSPLLKGELLVDEVREHVSYALPIGDVVPAVGDIVRSE